MDAVRATTEHAHQLSAGCVRGDHEITKEDAAAGWTLVGAAIVMSTPVHAYSPCSSLEAAVKERRTDIGWAVRPRIARPIVSSKVPWLAMNAMTED